jgi:hypothetical protein
MSVQQLMMHFQEESVPPGLKPYFTHGAYLPPIHFWSERQRNGCNEFAADQLGDSLREKLSRFAEDTAKHAAIAHQLVQEYGSYRNVEQVSTGRVSGVFGSCWSEHGFGPCSIIRTTSKMHAWHWRKDETLEQRLPACFEPP